MNSRPSPRRRPSLLTLAIAVGAPLLLLSQVASAQSASAARSRVVNATSAIESERFDEAERSLQDAEKFLEGLPDAEKAPLVKQIAETRAKIEPARKAKAVRELKSRLDSALWNANEDIGPRRQDAEKKVKAFAARLESDEVTKVLDAAEIAKYRERLAEIQKKLDGGGESAPAPVVGNARSAKSRVASARSLVESRRFENVEFTLEEAEKFLNGVPEDQAAPIRREMVEVRALLAQGEKAEKTRVLESRIDRYLRGATPGSIGAEDLLRQVAELLASDEGKELITAERAAEFRARLAEAHKSLAEENKKQALDRAQGFVNDLEELLSGDPLEGKDEFEAYKAWRDLDYRHRAAHKWLADIPKGDADRAAVEEKLAALKARIESASSTWSTAQVEAAVKGGWEFSAQSFAGWEEEKPNAQAKPNEMWMMQKTATAARASAYWLADEQMKKLCAEHGGNAVVKATVAEAQRTRDGALAKLNEAFNAAMDAAEKVPTPVRENRFDRVIASWMMRDAEECFKDSKYRDANVARAKALDERWEKEIEAIIKAAAELRAKYAKEAEAAWPKIVESINPDEEFRARTLARSKGDRILIKGAYNRAGWDFDGSQYDFAVRIDGVAIGGNYTDEINKAIQALWEKMDAPPLSDREKWDVIAVVEGPAQVRRRVTTKIIDAVTREEIGRIEGHEPEDGVEIKIVGLRAGPLAAGSR